MAGPGRPLGRARFEWPISSTRSRQTCAPSARRRCSSDYGAWLLAAAVLVVGVAAGWQVWQWYRLRHDRATAAIYLDAMFAAEQPGENAPASAGQGRGRRFLPACRRGPEGYRTLARLQRRRWLPDPATWPAPPHCRTRWPPTPPPIRCCATSPACSGSSRSSTPAIPARLRERLAPLAVPDNPWHAWPQEVGRPARPAPGPCRSRRSARCAAWRRRHAPQGLRGRAELLAAPARWLMAQDRLKLPGRAPGRHRARSASATALSRRAASLLPLGALAGCGWWDRLVRHEEGAAARQAGRCDAGRARARAADGRAADGGAAAAGAPTPTGRRPAATRRT